MTFKDKDGNEYTGYGMYAALSFDEGKTWPVKKLLTDGKRRFMDGGAWTGFFDMDSTHAEPRGYLAATQSPDQVIHLLSSRNQSGTCSFLKFFNKETVVSCAGNWRFPGKKLQFPNEEIIRTPDTRLE